MNDPSGVERLAEQIARQADDGQTDKAGAPTSSIPPGEQPVSKYAKALSTISAHERGLRPSLSLVEPLLPPRLPSRVHPADAANRRGSPKVVDHT